MNNISTGSVPAQIDCVRGIPVMVVTGRLDTTKAPLFDRQASPLLRLLDIYLDRETTLNGSSA